MVHLKFTPFFTAAIFFSVLSPTQAAELPSGQANPLTTEEVARHPVAGNCWIIINGKVYDISSYIPKHPAPENTITKYCGKNADLGWQTKDKTGKKSPHSASAARLLKRFEIGTLVK